MLLYAKMLKETETEETTDFLSLVAFQLGWGAGPLVMLVGVTNAYTIFQ